LSGTAPGLVRSKSDQSAVRGSAGGVERAVNGDREPKRTVLVADDEPVIRELVCTALTREGFRVLAAEDGDEAWALLRRHRPPVAVLDVRMPGRTGLELVEAIRADPHLRGTYVLLFTAERREQHVLAGQNAGANRYLIKPFSVAGLIRAVTQGFDLVDAPSPGPSDASEW
jgi:CheY-like chemotaxis protein